MTCANAAAQEGIASAAPIDPEGRRLRWELLHDTLLVEALDHEMRGATEIYEDLVRNLGADDPVRSDALFWLGHAEYTTGDLDPARDVLRECVRTGGARARCLELLGQLELEESSIAQLPVHWTFDTIDHGVLHPWRYADQGSIRIDDGESGNPRLVWTTTVDVQHEDRLVIGFQQPSPAPGLVSFEVATARFDAVLRLELHDIFGRRFTALPGRGLVEIQTGAPRLVRVDLAEAVVDDADRRETLDPSLLDRLEIVDVTARYGTRSGDNALLIDNFTVR